jgi:hypothetical protein
MWVETDFRVSRLNVGDVNQLKASVEKINVAVENLRATDSNFQRNGKNCAYVTVATPSYEFGLRVLISSLRRHSNVPIVVLASRRWSFEPKHPGVYFLVVPGLYNDRYQPDRHEFTNTLTKLWVFGLLCLDRVVYLDADCLVLKSVDDLFDMTGLCCAADCIEDSEAGRINSGLIAFDPSRELRDYILENSYETDSYDHGDQGALDVMLRSRVKYLPSEYNLTRHYAFFHGPETSISKVRVIHYIVKKPWEICYRETPDAALAELDDLWTEQLTHDELLQLVAFWRRRQFIAERTRLESLGQSGSIRYVIRTILRSPRRSLLVLASLGLACLLFTVILAVQISWIVGHLQH